MTRYIVLFIGLLGIIIPVWVISAYTAPADSLAKAVVLLIASGFLLGIFEIWRKLSLLENLSQEVITKNWSISPEDQLERATPELRLAILHRLHGGTYTLGQVHFTGYLIMALILFGLIGTFMGLVDTLTGTRAALETTGDIDALRSSLLGPIRGLSRAYGTAISGVASSVMLGLATVFLRRQELAFSRHLSFLTAGPLKILHPEYRQANAIDKLVEQGAALPYLTASFKDAIEGIVNLQKVIRDSNAQIAEQVATTIYDRAQAVRADFAEGIQALISATEPAIKNIADHSFKILDEKSQVLHERATRILATRLTHEKQHKDELVRFMALEHQNRREAEAGHFERLAAVVEQLSLKMQEQSDALGQQHLVTVSHLDQRITELTRAWQELSLNRKREEDAQWQAINADWDRLREQKFSHLDNLDRRLQEHLDKLNQQFAEFSERYTNRTKNFTDEAAKQLIEWRTELNSHVERATNHLDKRRQTWDDEHGQIIKQQAELAQILNATTYKLNDVLTRSDSLLDKQSSAAKIIDDAAHTVKVGGAELAGVAAMFGSAVEQYIQANERWVESLTYLERTVKDKREQGDYIERLSSYLDKTREVFEESLRLQRDTYNNVKTNKNSGSVRS